jgi:hypothetical protein
MKRLAFILVVALNGTLNAQNTFDAKVKAELTKWNLTHKKGDNDSLTFALFETLFTDPSTKFEFEKINPRFIGEVFVGINVKGNNYQITFNEWIQKEIRVLDTTKWEISFESFSGESLTGPLRFETIKLWNNITGQTREVEFLYNSDSGDGSVTNLYTIMEVRY